MEAAEAPRARDGRDPHRPRERERERGRERVPGPPRRERERRADGQGRPAGRGDRTTERTGRTDGQRSGPGQRGGPAERTHGPHGPHGPRDRERDRAPDRRHQAPRHPGPSGPRSPAPPHGNPPSLGPASGPPEARYLPSSPHPGLEEVEYYGLEEESEAEGLLDCHRCQYLCTGRACCQMVEVLLNLLILSCGAMSYNSTGGYTGITSLGGIYYYQYGGAYSGFHGADGEKAQQLDIQFYQLKLPTVTVAMAVGGALMTFCCLLLLLGVLRVPWHCPAWLVLEALLDGLIAVGYVPALYFYFRHLAAAYDSPVCREREQLYQSKGYNGFNCSLHGGDIGAGLFAAVSIVAFVLSAVLAVRGYRKVRGLKKKRPVEMPELYDLPVGGTGSGRALSLCLSSP
ncbi:MARVEL domain-containing protein 3 [Ornithorhynchus anatinus]|uniref:MARVEL domain containing 3 n=1 Tax=Ornithorhynchus anatinus TaxID=9258 RepID=F6RGA1_ORNAN|nr:MARVEL domain-containing protein 3 [Ornithorhynchus anatinus]